MPGLISWQPGRITTSAFLQYGSILHTTKLDERRRQCIITSIQHLRRRQELVYACRCLAVLVLACTLSTISAQMGGLAPGFKMPKNIKSYSEYLKYVGMAQGILPIEPFAEDSLMAPAAGPSASTKILSASPDWIYTIFKSMCVLHVCIVIRCLQQSHLACPPS